MNAVAAPRRSDLTHTQAVVQTLRRTYVVNIEHGLHARPCALLVKTLRAYSSSVEVGAGAETASGKSILGLIALAAAYGSEITFTIVGEDALQAMAAIHHLFAAHFEDAKHASTACAVVATTCGSAAREHSWPAGHPQIGLFPARANA